MGGAGSRPSAASATGCWRIECAAAAGLDGDARLLRRVRIRLVLWSGAITLVIVAVLGIVVFASVAGSLAGAGRIHWSSARTCSAELIQRAPDPSQADGRPFPIGFALGGSTSGTFAVVIRPDGSIIGPARGGLPRPAGERGRHRGRTPAPRTTASGDSPSCPCAS